MRQEIIAKELLEILVCPLCKSDVDLVEYRPGDHGLQCRSCKKIYPIREGIPVMLPEEALKGD